MNIQLELPVPDATTTAHSQALRERIVARMHQAGGRLTFLQFMEMSLYEPGFGYYSAGAEKFGAAGDFVTAPEFSTLFADCLARQVGAVLAELGRGEILEVGAGSGMLAARLLTRLRRDDAMPERYLILERSAELRVRQRETIANLAGELVAHVSWLDALPAVGFRGVVVANELLDALPVSRFHVGEEGIEEWHVAPAINGFTWQSGAPATPGLVERVTELQTAYGPMSTGYSSELGFQAEAWIATLADSLTEGVVFIIDYGYPRAEYYHPERSSGTLHCFYRHRAHDDPLILVGLQDISAHLEFSSIAEAAVQAGLTVIGLTTQAEFLLALGILDMAATVPLGSAEFMQAAAQIKQLTLPGEMGELVKVLALARGSMPTMAGFSGRDLRSRL